MPDVAPLHVPEQRFREQLEQEILGSEQLRARLLAGVFGVGLCIAMLIFAFVRARDIPYLRDRHAGFIIMAVLGSLTLYELLMHRRISQWMTRGTPAPAWVWYLNAFIEASAPTVAIFLLADTLSDPAYALSTPAVLLYFAFIILSTLRLNFKLSVFTGLVAAVEYLALAFLFLSRFPFGSPIDSIFHARIFYVQKAIILLIGGVTAGFVAHEIQRRLRASLRTIQERNEILRVFGQQTSPAIVEELLREEPQHISQRREACIMFLDVRGFTAFSEKREPEDVVAYLNTLFDFMIDYVNRHHGIIHQLLGDGFMAIFGAPISHGNDCQHAVHAAFSIVEHVERACAEGHIPPTRIGIGLHAGEVVAGTVGSAIHKEYKVTGDVVNLAARIEQLNKQYESQVLISEAVRRRIQLNGRIATEIGAVDVRGRTEPVRIYRLA